MLVSQLAAALKGLEADVNSLRNENQSLRRTVAQAIPGSEVAQAMPNELVRVVQGVPYAEIPSTRTTLLSGQCPRLDSTVSDAGTAFPAQHSPLSPRERDLRDRFSPPLLAPLVVRRALPRPFESGEVAAPLPVATVAAASGTRGGAEPWPTSLAAAVAAAAVAVELTPEGFSSRGGDAIAVQGLKREEMIKTGRLLPNLEHEQAWSPEHAVWLGRDAIAGDGQPLLGRVRTLQPGTASSVPQAVGALNAEGPAFSEAFCCVYSAANQGYYLLYRHGERETAMAILEGRPPLTGVGGERDSPSLLTVVAAPPTRNSADEAAGKDAAAATAFEASRQLAEAEHSACAHGRSSRGGGR